MNDNTQNLLSRLSGVQKKSADSWVARCPGHSDRTPSLSISEKDGGRIVLHCFAGCDTREVLAAIGLNFSVLFPKSMPTDGWRPEKRPFPAETILAALETELTIIQIFAADIEAGKPISAEDKARFNLACSRIQEAIDFGRRP
jgi:hypothetical protein